MEILRTEEPGGLQSMWSQTGGHDWVTNTTFIFMLQMLPQKCEKQCTERKKIFANHAIC